MEAVEEAVYKDFEKWKKEEGNSDKNISVFMEEVYAMKIGKGNIFDKIKAMILPPISDQSTSASTLLVENLACRENKREKREIEKKQGCEPQILTSTSYGCPGGPETSSDSWCQVFTATNILSLGSDYWVRDDANYWLAEDGKTGDK